MGKRNSFVDQNARRSQSKIFNNKAPGPGSYRLPSDFGQYDEITNSNRELVSKRTERTKDGN